MKSKWTNIKEAAVDLWKDDSGAQMVEKILIILAISLPLLAVLLFFSAFIRDWIRHVLELVLGNSAENNNPTDDPFEGI